MGIGLIVRRLLTKDKVDPERGDRPVSGGMYADPGKQYYQDLRTGQVYYVDDDGKRHEWWVPPWGENPS